ncbi:hypothetical protein BSKO_01782 [Bryopsis sp. KO-2023]|nr:hypothetical protein BSKO_01782 [Bryopsis sp. KO-2023]
MAESRIQHLECLEGSFDELSTGDDRESRSSTDDGVIPSVVPHQVIDSAPEIQARSPIQIQSAREQHTSSSPSPFAQYLSILASKTPLQGTEKWVDDKPGKCGRVHTDTTVVQIDSVGVSDSMQSREREGGDGGVKRKTRLRSALKRMAKTNRKNPNRTGLVSALKRKIRRQYPPGSGSFWQKRKDDAFIASMYLFDGCTPSQRSHSIVWATPILVTVTLVVFAYMAGAYPLYLQEVGKLSDYRSLGWDPKELAGRITTRGDLAKFDFGFLLQWGGRYLPSIEEGESYRWFTSLLLHQSFVHLLSNALIFIIVGAHLEYNYGGFRLLFVAFLAGLGGNFLSALLEDQCSMVVGASGVVFGLIGFGLVDLVFNQNVRLRRLWRILIAVVFVFFFIMTILLEEYSSHVSHVGGFLCGVVSSLLFLKSLKYERLEAAVVWLTLGFLVVFFTLLPVILYGNVLPDLSCARVNL